MKIVVKKTYKLINYDIKIQNYDKTNNIIEYIFYE